MSQASPPPTLTIVSVSWRSSAYLAPLLATLRTKAAAPEALSVLVVDNTDGTDAALAGALGSSVEIVPFDPRETNGSRAHAKALDYALSRVRSECAVVVDPDIHVFRSGWDAVCVRALRSHADVVAVGAPYPPWKVGKYHDFPSPPFCFVDVAAVRSLGASFAPFADSRRAAARSFVLRQLARAGGALTRRRYEKSAIVRGYAHLAERALGVFGPDTGWRIARAARERRRRSVLFDVVVAGGVASPFGDRAGADALRTLSREFELYVFEGAPMLTHKYGSGAPPWRTARGADEALWRRCIDEVEREARALT